MLFKLLFCFVLLIVVNKVQSKSKKTGFGPGKQDYGYVDVRKGAHMFWWLYHTNANVSDSSERPLIIWFQGGPGGSSCGYANFVIIGPLDLNLNHRKTTWVNDFNVLFVDSPVGAGYSYVDHLSYLSKDNKQIARDVITLMKSFYEELPQFKKTPLYAYGQSYGGKMAAEFVRMLYEETKLGKIESNVKGVAMGNSWISPIDSTLSWGPFLYKMSLVDERGKEAIDNQAKYTKRTFDHGKYAQATDEWRKTQRVVLAQTDGVDFYNVLTKTKKDSAARMMYNKDFIFGSTKDEETSVLDVLMNREVKKALDIPSFVRWGSQAVAVFSYLKTDFMKPVTRVVESLLNETTVNVHVYNGNVDLICSTPGQMVWINKLKWPAAGEFNKANRTTMWIDNIMEGYEKSAGKFTFFWINVAGHSVAQDNLPATRYFLKSMTGV